MSGIDSVFRLLRPVLLLKVGVGFVFLYVGLQALIDPESWIGFVPQWVGALLPRETFLLFHSVGELVLGVLILFLSRRWLATIGIVAFLDLAAILVFYGVDDVTFRDFGLAFAALALAALAASPPETRQEVP
ncbi:MAG: hypothetical protein AAB601_01270 [Patescibacteria group bacterium]